MSSYRITEMARPYIEYDMIQTYTELPDFPEFRVKLLHAVLSSHPAVSANSELYSLVTSLVQLGMDTHDMISNHSMDKEFKAARARQLKVLAGDYYSSRFYHLLAQSGQIEIVSRLSEAICETNRLKMNLYLTMKRYKLTAEQYIHQSVEIRAQLFLSFTGHAQEILGDRWPDLLNRITLLELLLDEISRSETLKEIGGSWGFWHVLEHCTNEEKKLLQEGELDDTKLKNLWHKYKVTFELYQMLAQQSKELRADLAALGSDKLARELLIICEPVQRYLETPKVSEEI